jgi:hypothetical protein
VDSQTDPAFMGWAFVFPMKHIDDPEYRQAYQEQWRKWLEQWNPPEEWMQ